MTTQAADHVLVPVKLTDAMRERMAHIADGPLRNYDEYWAEMLDAALVQTAAAQVGVCKTCGGLGYLVGDAEWEPYAVQCPECKAAAQVGETITQEDIDGAKAIIEKTDQTVNRLNFLATIERCKQVVDEMGARYHHGRDVLAALDKLKDEP